MEKKGINFASVKVKRRLQKADRFKSSTGKKNRHERQTVAPKVRRM